MRFQRTSLCILVLLTTGSCDCGPSAPEGLCARTGQCVTIDGPGEAISRTPAFARVDGFVAPVPNPLAIASTFGPRWKTSAGRTDLHRGVDYYDAIGTEVYAIGPGSVHGVHPDGSSQYPSGGNVLVIVHDLPAGRTFHERPVSRVFAVYMHLASFGVEEGDSVDAGDVVGAMGDTGDTDFVHLHFETRVETTCSLEYQTAHPEAACAMGFDPHVHPFLFVGGENADTISVGPLASDSGFSVEYVATRGDLDLDVIETDLGTLGFGARVGIDAQTTRALDDFDYGFLVVEPVEFVSQSETWILRLHFRERPSFIELRDVYGHGVRYGTP